MQVHFAGDSALLSLDAHSRRELARPHAVVAVGLREEIPVLQRIRCFVLHGLVVQPVEILICGALLDHDIIVGRINPFD